MVELTGLHHRRQVANHPFFPPHPAMEVVLTIFRMVLLPLINALEVPRDTTLGASQGYNLWYFLPSGQSK